MRFIASFTIVIKFSDSRSGLGLRTNVSITE
jgi:hypothetical protein